MIEGSPNVLLAPLGLLLYLMIAMVFGCPYCPYPDLRWPVTLVRYAFGTGDRS